MNIAKSRRPSLWHIMFQSNLHSLKLIARPWKLMSGDDPFLVGLGPCSWAMLVLGRVDHQIYDVMIWTKNTCGILCGNCRISKSSLNIVSITCLRIPLLLLERLWVTLITQDMGRKRNSATGHRHYIYYIGWWPHVFRWIINSPHLPHLRATQMVQPGGCCNIQKWCLHDWSNPHCLNPKVVPCFRIFKPWRSKWPKSQKSTWMADRCRLVYRSSRCHLKITNYIQNIQNLQ